MVLTCLCEETSVRSCVGACWRTPVSSDFNKGHFSSIPYMLLTLTDGLLPVKKFDRSFREKVHFKDKWRHKQYIWMKWLFCWNFVSTAPTKNLSADYFWHLLLKVPFDAQIISYYLINVIKCDIWKCGELRCHNKSVITVLEIIPATPISQWKLFF